MAAAAVEDEAEEIAGSDGGGAAADGGGGGGVVRARFGAVPFGTCTPMEKHIHEGKCMPHDEENCILLALSKREHPLIPRTCLRREDSQSIQLPDKPSLPPPLKNKGMYPYRSRISRRLWSRSESRRGGHGASKMRGFEESSFNSVANSSACQNTNQTKKMHEHVCSRTQAGRSFPPRLRTEVRLNS